MCLIHLGPCFSPWRRRCVRPASWTFRPSPSARRTGCWSLNEHSNECHDHSTHIAIYNLYLYLYLCLYLSKTPRAGSLPDICNNLRSVTALQSGTGSSSPSRSCSGSAELTIDNICLPINRNTHSEQKYYLAWSLNPGRLNLPRYQPARQPCPQKGSPSLWQLGIHSTFLFHKRCSEKCFVLKSSLPISMTSTAF